MHADGLPHPHAAELSKRVSIQPDSLHTQKYAASANVLNAMNALKEEGALTKWGKIMEEGLQRRNIFLGNLKQVSMFSSRTPGFI